MNIPVRQLLVVFGLMSAVLVFGTVGFRLVEGWELFDCFYMSLITLTTVGYREVSPLSLPGRVFNSVFILAGVTAVLGSITILADAIIKMELGDYFGKRRRQRMLDELSDHFIVCGAGRVGRGVVRELRRSGAKMVLIDSRPDRVQWAADLGMATITGDATQDETLRQARIDVAKGLVAAIGSDAENVYVTLSARVLNPELIISARATDEQAEEKLRLAGATTVFTPYSFIGHRLAQSLLRPHVLTFLDVASAFGKSDLDLEFEQVKVSATSPVGSKTLEESRLKQKHGVIVLAVMKPQGEMKFNPAADTRIEAGDVLIAIGERSKLKQVEMELEA